MKIERKNPQTWLFADIQPGTVFTMPPGPDECLKTEPCACGSYNAVGLKTNTLHFVGCDVLVKVVNAKLVVEE